MITIISPAKKMKDNFDTLEPKSKALLIDKSRVLLDKIKSLNNDELKAVLKCNDTILQQNIQRFNNFDFERNLSAALLTYDGIQYQKMAAQSLSIDAYDFLQEHLCILSGFYGLLRVYDGIRPYRLEMQAKLQVENYKNLYEFWSDEIYKTLITLMDDEYIINLASEEYAKVIRAYCKKEKFITFRFGFNIQDRVVERGTMCKMARGALVKFIADHKINDVNMLKEFNEFGFVYSKTHSLKDNFVFLKEIDND